MSILELAIELKNAPMLPPTVPPIKPPMTVDAAAPKAAIVLV